MCWLAGDDPVKLEQFQRIPILEYWSILDAALHRNKEALKKAKK